MGEGENDADHTLVVRKSDDPALTCTDQCVSDMPTPHVTSQLMHIVAAMQTVELAHAL